MRNAYTKAIGHPSH